MKDKVIAIDGPSGSGKSTIARIIASRLSLTYLDTGAMFRALAFVLKDVNIDFSQNILKPQDKDTLTRFLTKLKFEYSPTESVLVRLNNDDLTNVIREHSVSEMASRVSKFSEIRNYLKDKQREISSIKASVLEGRDIGTVVFPNAALKIYLVADSRIRAQRRFNQLVEKDPDNKKNLSVESILTDIDDRDLQDQTRDIAPLRKAPDAISIDTTNLSIDEVTDTIINEYNKNKIYF